MKLSGIRPTIASAVLAMGFSFPAFGSEAWTRDTFDTTSFTVPDHWLTGGKTDIIRNGSVTTGSGDPYQSLSVGGEILWDFTEPQDITSVSLYFADAGCSGVAFDGVYVKYEDAADYTLVGSALTYEFAAPGSTPQWLKLDTNGDADFKNVISLKLVPTQVNAAWYGSRVHEIVVTGTATDSEGAEWQFTDAAAEDYEKPSDAILPTDSVVESSSGFAADEYDDSITTYAGHQNGNTYEMNFSKPMSIRAIEMFSYGTDANRTKFAISDIYVKEYGQSDWRRVGGSSQQFFELVGMRAVQHSKFVSTSGDVAIDNAGGIRVVLSAASLGWVPLQMAEVYVCGYEAIQPNPQWEVTKEGSQAYISDGVWKFKATLTNNRLKNLDGTYRTTGPYAMTVNTCTVYPPAVTPLDFSKPVTNAIPGETKEYAINELNPQLGTVTSESVNCVFAATDAGSVAGKLTLPAANDYQLIINYGSKKGAFCKCEHIDYNLADLPAGLTHVKSYAFADSDVYGAVNCPNLTNVDPYSFARTTRLTTFTAPKVTNFGTCCFVRSGVTGIDLGETGALKTIDYAAFELCTNLVSFTPFLPKTCTRVNREAFYKCYKLASPLVYYGGTNNAKDCTDSNDWTIFCDCWSLPSVDLSQSTVKFLTRECFQRCYSLTTVKLPDNFESFGKVSVGNQTGPFMDCTNLVSVTPFIPNTVTNVSQGTFTNCPKLQGKLKMLGVIDIGPKAVMNAGVESLEFGPNLKSVAQEAFENCSNLKTISHPKELTGVTFANFTFSGCTSLTGELDFSFASKFGNQTFSNVRNVNKLILGSCLTNVGDMAFLSMTGLRRIDWKGDKPTTLGGSLFQGCTAKAVTNYVAAAYADNWQSVVTGGGTLGKKPLQWTSNTQQWICLLYPSIGFIWLAD